MSRSACLVCGKLVSTTADPNPYEGFFLSLDQLEKLEQAINDHPTPSILLLRYRDGELEKVGAGYLVLCDACRPAPLSPPPTTTPDPARFSTLRAAPDLLAAAKVLAMMFCYRHRSFPTSPMTADWPAPQCGECSVCKARVAVRKALGRE